MSGQASLPAGLLIRTAAVVLVIAAYLILTAPVAGAHAYLDRSNPADGSSLAHPPHELRLGFSEHVVLPATRITLTDGQGRRFPVSDLRLVTDDVEDTEVPSEVVGTLPHLARNTYRVAWETLSSDDLHRTSGILVFGVRTTVSSTSFHETAPAAGEAAATGVLLLGLALALGGLLARRTLAGVQGPTGSALRTLITRLAAGGAALAVVASLAQPAIQASTGEDLVRMASGSYGLRWAVREAGLLLLLVATLRQVWRPRGRWFTAQVLAGGGLAALGTAWLGHAAAALHEQPLRLAATTVHIAAGLTWSGAVVCLAVALVRGRRGLSPLPTRAALRGFAVPAAACVSVLAVTGTYLASDTVGSVDAALRTAYGRSFLLKLLLAGVVAGVALGNHRRVRERVRRRVPTRTVAVEGALSVMVVLVTAVLVSAQPATEPQFVDAGPAASAGPVSGKVSDLQESFEIRPNRPGATEAVITVFDTRRPASGEVTGVSVRVRTKPSVAAVPLGDGHWVAQLPYLHQGSSAIRVVANRDGAPDVATTYRWTVASAGAIPRTWVSRASLRPGLRWACLLLTAGVSAAWAVVLLRRRRRRRRWATTLAVAMLADAGRETVRPPRVLTTVGRR